MRNSRDGMKIAERFANKLDNIRSQMQSVYEELEEDLEAFGGSYGLLPFVEVESAFNELDNYSINAYNAAMYDDEAEWEDAWGAIDDELGELLDSMTKAIRNLPSRSEIKDVLMDVFDHLNKLSREVQNNV